MNQPHSHLNGWLLPVLVMTLLLAWGLAFNEALSTVIPIWYGNEIYNHCFLILPGALFLIYREKIPLQNTLMAPNFFVLVPFLIILMIGMIGYIGSINVLMHFSAFASIGAIAWLCLGSRSAKIIWYPLLFLLFAIPVGEELVPLLQEIAADISEFLLRLAGVPIFRAGLFIEIPEGKFVVAEACSGIKFLTSTLAFGAFYAQISYTQFSRKLMFMLLALIVPILANALRVFGTILIGHHWGMESASGADHLLFGWLLFAIVLLILIAIGNTFSEPKPKWVANKEFTVKNIRKLHTALILVSVLLLGKYGWSVILSSPVADSGARLNTDVFSSQAVKQRHAEGWQPIFDKSDDSQFLRFNAASTDLFVAWYSGQDPDAELIVSTNRIFHPTEWTLVKSKRLVLGRSNQTVNAKFIEIISSHGVTRYVLYWYQIGDKGLINNLSAKLLQIVDKLTGGQGAGAVIAYSVAREDAEFNIVAEELSRYAESQLDALQQYLPE